MHKSYYVKLTKDMGRGMFADRDITKGETIAYCELLVLSEGDTAVVNTTDLQYYTFKYNDTQDCLVLGDGEIFNHTEDENVSYKLRVITDSVGTRTLMHFEAIKDIRKNEQLFINYSRDVEVKPKQYTVNLVG